MPRSSRKRRHSDDDTEEEVVTNGSSRDHSGSDRSDDEDDENGERDSEEDSDDESSRKRKKSRKSKKSKKSKKKKRKHHHRSHKSSRKKRSRRHESSGEEEEEDDVDDEGEGEGSETDREGGSTPEVPDFDGTETINLVKEEGEIEEEERGNEHRKESSRHVSKRDDRRSSESERRRSRSKEKDRDRDRQLEKRGHRSRHRRDSDRSEDNTDADKRHRRSRRKRGDESEQDDEENDRGTSQSHQRREKERSYDKYAGEKDHSRKRHNRRDRSVEENDDERHSSTRTHNKDDADDDSTKKKSLSDKIKEKLTKKKEADDKKQDVGKNVEEPQSQAAEMNQDDLDDVAAKARSSGGVISLSVDDTNALRAKLGLPPLKSDSDKKKEEEMDERRKAAELAAQKAGGKVIENSSQHEVHVPAINLSEKSETEKIRERIKERRLKREQEAKLLSLKKLGESDSDDEATNWVEKQKKLQKEKEKAQKRAKMLEELDDEFGVSNIVEEERKKDKAKEYSENHLKGLRVEHSLKRFDEGKNVILTLKDSDILDENAEDTLVNVNILDSERAEKRLDEIKKAKIGYNAYDMEEIDSETGELKRKNMLDKYDEEIDGEKRDSFTIGNRGEISEEERKKQIKEKLKMKAKATLESLEMPELKIASDYMTAEEHSATFKKPKKKKKVKRKVLRADDLLGEATESFGSRSNKREEKAENVVNIRGSIPMDIDPEDSYEIKPDLSNIKVDPDAEDDDHELENALQRTRRLKQRSSYVQDVADVVLSEKKKEPVKVKQEEVTGSEFISTFEDEDQSSRGIILNETAEFCRNLGAQVSFNEIKREEMDEADRELLEFEESLKSKSHHRHEEKRGKWETVEDDKSSDGDDMDIAHSDSDGNDRPEDSTILDEEPDLQKGVAAALKLAASKGYFEKEEKQKAGSSLKHLQAKNYTIEDKMKDDDRSSRRDRYSGPSQAFQEKAGYIPKVQLEYADETGRKLNQKEAFRYLSHRFHGKGSGKMKTEKRMKKVMEESLMKNMSSTDTPLQTLEKLKKKQQAGATPYVVLSGNKSNPQDLSKM